MEPAIELSVIIPCYRVAAYLPACLDSACALPTGRAEILCVDDASPDGSGAILAEYAALHPHLRVLTHPVNRGLSAGRNTGLDQARGEYVLFLDGDDLLCAGAALRLVRQARDGRLDILQAAYMRFAGGSKGGGEGCEELPSPPQARATGVQTGDASLAEQCTQKTFEPMTVTRLYRRSFLLEHKLRMAEGYLFEDELFTAPAFLRAGRVQVSEELLYRYRQREDGIMGGFAASADWCGHYLRIAGRLAALCEGGPTTPGRRALRRRAAALALAIPKNIVACGLSGAVRCEALGFVRAHAREIAGLAAHSGSAALRAQGALLRVSLPAFLRLYSSLRRLR